MFVNSGRLSGFFATGDVDGSLLRRLKNVELTPEAVAAVLPARLDDVIMNLRKEDFVSLLTDDNE